MNDYRGGVYGRAYSSDLNGAYSYTYHYRDSDITVDSAMENAHYYGVNFQQQWDYALKTDPEFLFVTGWNEWTMGRFETWQGSQMHSRTSTTMRIHEIVNRRKGN